MRMRWWLLGIYAAYASVLCLALLGSGAGVLDAALYSILWPLESIDLVFKEALADLGLE